MFSRTMFCVSAFVVAIAANFCHLVPLFQTKPPRRRCSLSTGPKHQLHVGLKDVSGYFVQQNSVCRVTLMIAEKH